MIVKLLTEHHLEFLSLKIGCRGSFESTHVKMPHCWTSHALAHLCMDILWARSTQFCKCFSVCLYFVCACSKLSGESV